MYYSVSNELEYGESFHYSLAFKVDYSKKPFNKRFAIGRLGIGCGEMTLKGFVVKLCPKPFIETIG